MRTIKFRGKRLLSEDWEYGNLIQRPCGGSFIETGDMRLCPMQDFSIGQFTGLRDKNGKEIYEGDIVRFPTLTHKNKYRIGYIGFHQLSASFRIVTKTSDLRLGNRYGVPEMTIDVIGNIHDNPELLKTKS